MQVYLQHVGDLDVGHVGVVEMNLNQNLELSPTYFLYFEGWFVNFCMEKGLPLIGFWKEECNLNTTFLMR